MSMKFLSLIFTLSFLFFSCAKSNLPAPIGYGYKNPSSLSVAKGEVGNFALLDHNGVFHELYRYSNAKLIVLISQGNSCPIIEKHSGTINELKSKFESQGVVFFLINANPHDTREAIITEAKNYNVSLPVLIDHSQTVTELLGITRTAEAVVIDPRGWKMIYRGAISDRLDYGVDKQIARNNYLENILSDTLQGHASATAAAPAKGCLISFEKPKSLSYSKVIAPIIANKCLNCHTQEKGFLPLLDGHEKLKGWSEMARETILTDRMPPWSSDPLYGKYSNDISLTAQEKRLLIQWLNAGAPNDSNKDPLKNFSKKLTKKIEPTSLVYSASMAEDAVIPPGGDLEYRYMQLGEQVPFDMWVTAFKTSSTNPRQLHHEAIMVTSRPLSFYEQISKSRYERELKQIKESTDGDISNYLLWSMFRYERRKNSLNFFRIQNWAAGKPQPYFLKPGFRTFIPKGSYLILETHYMGTGKEEKERTTVEFYGSKTKPAKFRQLYTAGLTNTNFVIPPMAKNFVVETEDYLIKRKIYIIDFLGHLHMRGKSAKLEATLPSGEKKILFSIPNYYYGWQTGAALTPETPIEVNAGTKLKSFCTYDNSPENPFNPDPTKAVRFGQRLDRTEMCKLNFTYYETEKVDSPLWEFPQATDPDLQN